MPLKSADAFVLRTHALKESDKIVSFYTREWGKCRGVARAARRPKSKFGSSLEPLTRVRIQFFEREGRDLCSIDHCEVVQSLVAAASADLSVGFGIALMVEIADRMLPDREVSDATFRLLHSVTAELANAPAPSPWLPLTYYMYWMVRLGGFLPTLPQPLAGRIARQPLGALIANSGETVAVGPEGRQLREILRTSLEDHLESSLRTWPLLAPLQAALAPATE